MDYDYTSRNGRGGGGYVDLKSVLRSQYDVCNGPVIIVVLNVYSVIRP